MAVKDIRPLKRVENEQMMDALRRELSLEYQARVPEATKAGIEASLKALTKYPGLYNEFVSALVNRIGLVISKNMIWTNPLAIFKRGMLEWGDTIEEIYTGLLEAHTYDPDRENMEQVLFSTELPPVEANFHRVNRQEFYKFTVNESLLKRAFLEPGGLSNFINDLMSAPTTSDNWDEFLITCSLFAHAEKNGGFYHVNIPDLRDWDSDGSDSRLALRKIRAMSETLTFPSTNYNAARMPVHAPIGDQVLIATPRFKAAIDVEALAAAFNMDKVNLEQRIITVPEDQLNIPGAGAILTTDEFFVIADQKIETTTMPNPASLHTNYFLHHWQVISHSRFAPAVVFGTMADDEVITIQAPVTTVSAIAVTDVNGVAITDSEVTRGFIYQATATATTVAGEDRGVVFSVTGNGSTRTRISAAGVLLVAPDEPSATLTVTAESVQIQSGAVTAKTIFLAVTGEGHPDWPEGIVWPEGDVTP